MALVAKFSAHHYFFEFTQTMVVWAQWLGGFLDFDVRNEGEARRLGSEEHEEDGSVTCRRFQVDRDTAVLNMAYCGGDILMVSRGAEEVEEWLW
jgi:hypothetical protein